MTNFQLNFFNYIRDNKGLLEINNIIIDLRYNEGGSETVFLSFLDELEKYEKENKKLKIHILVGRNTFFCRNKCSIFSKEKNLKMLQFMGSIWQEEYIRQEM